MTKRKVAVVGGGINGPFSAFFRNEYGDDVDLFEARDSLGGACNREFLEIEGAGVECTFGGTVFGGTSQKILFERMGILDRIRLHTPDHPKIVESADGRILYFSRNDDQVVQELRDKWDEYGDVLGYFREEALVAGYLSEEFSAGLTPSLWRAEAFLGRDIVSRWFGGTAESLLRHFFTDERTMLYMGLPVTESGPVGFREAGSAFSLALMLTSTVFGLGRWGFVEGRLWAITHALQQILIEKGVNVRTNARVRYVDPDTGLLEATVDGRTFNKRYDRIVMAVDPGIAAMLIDDRELEAKIAAKRSLGSSGKMIVIFRNPIRWKNDTGHPDFDTAFRFGLHVSTLAESERLAQRIRQGEDHHLPNSIQVYCDGAAMRKFGPTERYESVTLFANYLGLTVPGAEMPASVGEFILGWLRDRVENPEDIALTKLLGPVDVRNNYGFRQGNYDGFELCGGQVYDERTLSSDPAESFYRFGHHERIRICHAAVHPCGSVSGTGGYIEAMEDKPD